MEFEDDNEERRIQWMTFIGALVGMALVAFVILYVAYTMGNNHAEDELSRRTRVGACQSLENEITRATCISGWGG